MEKCIKCTEPKTNCNALGFLLLPSSELVPLCKKRKQFLGLTAQNVADKSTVPVGTVNRFFSGELGDFRYDTAHHIVCALWDIKACDCPENTIETTGSEAELKQLRETVRLQWETIQNQTENIKRLREQIDRKDDYIDRLARKAGI